MIRILLGISKPVTVVSMTSSPITSMKTGYVLTAEDAVMSEQTDMFGVRRDAIENRSREIQKREIEKIKRILQGDKKRQKSG